MQVGSDLSGGLGSRRSLELVDEVYKRSDEDADCNEKLNADERPKAKRVLLP